MKTIICILISFLLIAGCEGTNLDLATEAGVDAVKAITLTDEQVRQLSGRAAALYDQKHRVARTGSGHARRLDRLTRNLDTPEGMSFNIRIYEDSKINAFAMADGSIRIYSGLMDHMEDGELLFVIGHEIGHVVKKHVKKKMMVALAASALRKGIASQESWAGYIAASALGGFVQQLVNAQFSQEEEREADDVGVQFLIRNEFDRQRAVETSARALEKLAGAPSNLVMEMLASHPSPEKRAKRIRSGSADSSGRPSLIQKVMAQIFVWFNLLKHMITGN